MLHLFLQRRALPGSSMGRWRDEEDTTELKNVEAESSCDGGIQSSEQARSSHMHWQSFKHSFRSWADDLELSVHLRLSKFITA